MQDVSWFDLKEIAALPSEINDDLVGQSGWLVGWLVGVGWGWGDSWECFFFFFWERHSDDLHFFFKTFLFCL